MVLERIRSLMLVLASVLLIASSARADAVLDANMHAVVVAASVKATPLAARIMAITQVSVHDAERPLPPAAAAQGPGAIG